MTESEKIRAEVKGLYDKIDLCIGELVKGRATHNETLVANAQHKMESLVVQAQQVLSCINDAIEEPVSEELEEAAKRYATEGDEISGTFVVNEEVYAFKAGAQWQKQQTVNKACEWLMDYAYFSVNDLTGSFNDEDLVNRFKKAMEG